MHKVIMIGCDLHDATMVLKLADNIQAGRFPVTIAETRAKSFISRHRPVISSGSL